MKRFGRASPIEFWSLGYQMAMTMAEAQAVMAMRIFGLAGAWSLPPSEAIRMIAEKPPAFMRAASAAGMAAANGKRPDQILSAALKPVRQKTRANSRRLAKRGPRRTKSL